MLGRWGEECASKYLESHEYTILDRNWRTRGGEIDLVAFDPQRNSIVAIEVKTRSSHRFGTPEEAISYTKIKRIRALLLQWLLTHDAHAQRIDVDVIGLTANSANEFTINHVRSVQ